MTSAANASLAKLGIGTAALGLPYGIGGQHMAHDTAAGLLRDALDAGVGYVDTAAAYGDAETVVGLVAPRLRATRARVCTKLTVPACRASGALAAMNESLARLQLESVDTVLLHSADTAALRDASLRVGLEGLVAAGLTTRIGVSTYGAQDAAFAQSLPWVQSLQVEHSILNPSVLRALGERGAARNRVEVIARSVLCKGLLTTRRSQAGAVTARIAATLDDLEAFARDRGLDLPGLALRFALDSPGVDVVLVGVSSGAELAAALRAAAQSPLTPAELRDLAAFDRSSDDASHPELWPALNAGGAA